MSANPAPQRPLLVVTDLMGTTLRDDGAVLPAYRAAFAAMITRMDRDIGRLTDLVHARGLDSRTLILFISDNGPHQEGGAEPAFFKSSGGLRGIKRDLYEGGIRVPTLARRSLRSRRVGRPYPRRACGAVVRVRPTRI